MKKEDLEDFLSRTTALVMVPILGILPEKAAGRLTGELKRVVLKSILDFENIRPKNVGPDNVKSQLRGMEKEIFNE